jgi:hypothetical protein
LIIKMKFIVAIKSPIDGRPVALLDSGEPDAF